MFIIAREKGPLALNDDHVSPPSHKCPPSPPVIGPPTCKQKIDAIISLLQMYFTEILLPVCPASLTYRNPQRHKIICGMCLIGRKDQSISTCVFVEISCSCNYCGSYMAVI